MMNSRRNFLRIGSFALVGSCLLTSFGESFAQVKSGDDYFALPEAAYSAKYMNAGTFEPLLQTEFELADDAAQTFSLKLVEVEKKENKSRRALETFNLIFEAKGKRVLESKNYSARHAAIGEFSLFISPVGRNGNRYQAVFSRLY